MEAFVEVYDISQEIPRCAVFPGDPAPQRQVLMSMEQGDVCNLSAFSMCAHNGTHVDAPAHFILGGKTVGEMGLEPFVGMACVLEHEGEVTAADAAAMLGTARSRAPRACRRILIKGRAVVSLEAARVFASADMLLLGNESQSVGPEGAPMAVHKALLGAGVALLEGIRLSRVPEGVYLLSSAPLPIVESEGAPCRAVLIALP